MPAEYINGLGENPLFKNFLDQARKYEQKEKYNEAIAALNNCLSHPQATDENKVAANIIIGNCYCVLGNLEAAKDHYKSALNQAKKTTNKNDKLQEKAAALGNIGLIYFDRGKLDEALKYQQQALAMHQKIGYELGTARALNNIELIYRNLGKPDEALKYHQRHWKYLNGSRLRRKLKL